MKPKILKLIFIFLIFCKNSHQARILGFFPITSKSHVTFAHHVMKTLAERGHNVTLVSPFYYDLDVENLRELVISLPGKPSETRDSIGNMFSVLPRILNQSLLASHTTINHPDFRQLMKDDGFDLLVSGFFFNNFQLGLAAHFNCPSVVLSSIPNVATLNELVGQPNNINLIPSPMSGIKTGQMSFWERVVNFVTALIELGFTFYVNYLNGKYYRINFPEPKYPTFEDVKQNVSMLFINSHFSQAGVQPYLPNVIEISGIQVNTNPQLLPTELRDWIEEETHGTIFVSLESSYKDTKSFEDSIEILLNSFRKLKQRVIWKIQDTKFTYLPKNVKISDKISQDSILSQPNIVAFVTNGNFDSYNEALYYAKPVVGIPFTADQFSNTRRAQDDGWGEVITYKNLTESGLDEALKQVIYVKSYKGKASELSKLYRDRPQSAMNATIFWMEYVMRHGGAHHLKYQGRNLTVWQTGSLDILGAIVISLAVTFKIFSIIYRNLLKKITKCSSSQKKCKPE